ncbi:MAG: mevalonate kinase, partial [Hydrogenovibrio sp.]|nr:mevalonate kinase [Hydrogenovibrio sp.]
MKWSSSAPANLMIMGEHSVVFGHRAIATALNQRITIDWESRSDKQIHILSALGEHQTSLDTLEDHTALRWVMATLRHFRPELSHGFNIEIRSEFESTLGLGSSAAVLAAMLGGVLFHLRKKLTRIETFQIGHKIIQQVQGRGSGTDLAASLAGGMILFNPKKQTISKIDKTLPLSLIYSGYKTPTGEVLQKVSSDWQTQPKLLDELYHLMGSVTKKAFNSLQENNMEAFYHLINTYQGLMDALGVNDQTLSRIVYALREHKDIHASKISGSGLGDCVLGFGENSQDDTFLKPFQQISIQTSQ